MPCRRLTLSLLAQVGLLSAPLGVLGQVVPGGLGTRVNGSALGSCSSGICRIEGGTTAGNSLFLRLGRYDTRSNIERVDLDSRRRQTVVVGVGDPAGSFFATPLKLTTPANLIWLSPGGLWLGAGSQVINAPSQLFSTAASIRLGSGLFSAAGGGATDLGQLGAIPDLDPGEPGQSEGIVQRLGLAGSAPIVLAGGRLTVDRHLLLDSGRGSIVTAPGSSNELKAGGRIHISGGQLDLQQLRVEGGGTVTLQALADGGQARLRQAQITGRQVLVYGRGGVTAAELTVEAGEPGVSGLLQLETGNTPSAAMDLQQVMLRAGDVQVQAGGDLRGQRLRAAAHAGSGVLVLQSREGSIELTDTALQGGSVVVDTHSDLRINGLQATANHEVDQGGIMVQAGHARLHDLNLQGSAVALYTTGDLRAEHLTVKAGQSQGTGALRLESGLSGNPQGQTIVKDSMLEADAINMLAPGGFVLERVRLDSSRGGDRGLIQIEEGPASHGAGRLTAVDLKAQQISISSGSGLALENVVGVAGEAGRRGLIRLQGQAGQDKGPGGLSIKNSSLSAHLISLQSGDITVDHSEMQAPKGMLHLEAKAAHGTGNISIRRSDLTAEVNQWDDLVNETGFVNTEFGVTLAKDYPALIGLYADGRIDVDDGSRISVSQEVSTLAQHHPDTFESRSRLSATSGVIVLDANAAIRVSQSELAANASHTIAGDIVLHSSGADQPSPMLIDQSTLSSSGGLGAGDIRLSSKSGMMIRDSRLLSLSDQQPAAQRWDDLYAGGAITLSNHSSSQPLIIENTELRAQQSTAGGTYRAIRHNEVKGRPTDPLEVEDSKPGRRPSPVSTGGAITVASKGGISIMGADSLISARSADLTSSPAENFGGIIRIMNENLNPIEISGGVKINLETGPARDNGSLPYSTAGELLIWNQGPVRLSQTIVNAISATARPPQSSDAVSSIMISSGEDMRIHDSRFAMGGPDSVNGTSQPTLVLASRKPERSVVANSFWTSGQVNLPLKVRPATTKDLSSNKQSLEQSKSHRAWNSGDDRAGAISEKVKPADFARSRVVIIRPGQSPVDLQPASQALSHLPVVLPLVPTPLNAEARRSERTGLISTRGSERTFPTGTNNLRWTALEDGNEPLITGSMNFRSLTQAEAEDSLARAETQAAIVTRAALGLADRPAGSLAVPVLQKWLQTATIGQDRHAILRISLSTPDADGRVQLDQIMIPPDGEIRGWTSQLPAKIMQDQIRALHRISSQQLALSSEPSRLTLGQMLLGPALEALNDARVTSLLLSLDRGLQAIPFSAIPIRDGVLGERFAITVTPALALTDLGTIKSRAGPTRNLLAGSTRFNNGLAPLPMVRQELERIAAQRPATRVLLDEDFTVATLRRLLQAEPFDQLHIASHAELQTKEGSPARIYTANDDLTLSDLALTARTSSPQGLDLVVVSACRTALGDELSELGIAGLALQAGASSALGSLWTIDDAAATAFAVQFHRLLDLGYSKEKALQTTQAFFRRGDIHVKGNDIVNPNGEILVAGLSPADQARLGAGLQHPYFWAGMLLSGRPW